MSVVCPSFTNDQRYIIKVSKQEIYSFVKITKGDLELDNYILNVTDNNFNRYSNTIRSLYDGESCI